VAAGPRRVERLGTRDTQDFYGVDVVCVRTTLAEALDDPTVLEGWRIELDGERPEAGPRDYEHADGLE